MNLIQRVQDILLKPKQTWPAIDAEPATQASIYKGYVLILAAIPPVASFLGLIFIVGPGFWGLSTLVLGYVLALVNVFVLTLIVDALAPSFGGTKGQVSALKLVAYASTAGWVGGVFHLVPGLWILGIIASLYGIYLIYLGLPVLMKCPQDKAGAYTAVVIVCAIVIYIVLGALTAMGGPMRVGSWGGWAGSHGSAVTIKTPGGEIKVDTAKMDDLSKKLEEAGKRMEEAQKSGDPAATGKAMGEMMGALTGGNGQPIAPADLKAVLPEALGELKRESIESQGGQAIGIASSMAKASYAAADKRVQLTITDLGGTAGLAALAAWSGMTMDKETAEQVEKVYKQGERTVREEYRKDGSHGEVTVLLTNGVVVEAKGQQVDLAALKKALEAVGLDKLEAVKRPAKA
ncbi:Yip1 family protein [Rhizobacter sp. P5_C2]